MAELVTRTVINSTRIAYRTVINGELSADTYELFVEGSVGDPIKACKKEKHLSKYDSIVVVAVQEDKTTMAVPTEDFMAIAKPLEFYKVKNAEIV